MTRVELVLTDTRLWARSDSTHWDGVPSVLPTSDGAGLVAGAPLQATSPAVSVVELLDADRIAFPAPAAPPTPAEGLAVVFDTALAGLRLAAPCEQLTVFCPSSWGERRRAVLEAAGRRVAARVRIDSLATRATALYPDPGQQQRIVVLEVATLSTTATVIGRSRDETWVQACEFEPNLGADELTGAAGAAAVAALMSRLLDGLVPNYVLALGLSDAERLEAVRLGVSGCCGVPVDVRPVPVPDLIHGVVSRNSVRPASGPPVPMDPGGSLRDRARQSRKHGPAGRTSGVEPDSSGPRRGSDRNSQLSGYGVDMVHGTGGRGSGQSRLRWVVAAAVVLVAAVVVGAVLLGHRGGDANSGATASPVSDSDTVRTAGRVEFPVPARWQVTTPAADRTEMQPAGDAHQRITVAQTALKPGASVEDVANSLAAQLRAQPAGQVSELDREAVFADRPGLSYQQFRTDGTTIYWHVMVDQGMQVSVGCQYPNEQWPRISAVCERVVAGLRITPQ
ncbi:type VII secretion-associated protein [Nocardia stercoris]|uniref:Type VII secretion-associated protein n=1 Tax=Nocardia stercoris TaxID=2483361 RepID=A0A3M2L4D3_9NOCA|nr:type VII secretion-associated protein [Nocardia stercoris]RMI31836.1 type VII secretion-associated protein [Nocardia stercoris]